MIKCICIDDTGKPNEISAEKWVKLDENYHITHIYWHPNQGIQGVSIYEKPLDESCAPYESFRLTRFGIAIKDFDKFIELIKNCSDLDDLDISELIKGIEILENA